MKSKSEQRRLKIQQEAAEGETVQEAETMQSPAGKIEVIVKADAPFDYLKHEEVKVGKQRPVLAPVSIKQHRNAAWLDILTSSSNS